MKVLLLSVLLLLTGCTTISGDYVPPSTGKMAYLLIDNSKISSINREIRIVGTTTSGCIGSAFVTNSKFAAGGERIFRVAIPAGEKVVLEYTERVDLSSGAVDWIGKTAFSPEEGKEYQFHSYFKLPLVQYVKTNEAPEVLIKAVERYAPGNTKMAAMVGVFVQNGKKSVWIKPEDLAQPKEKSYGYCPAK